MKISQVLKYMDGPGGRNSQNKAIQVRFKSVPPTIPSVIRLTKFDVFRYSKTLVESKSFMRSKLYICT